jgi:formamidopyrimidine-DNA glycosylase
MGRMVSGMVVRSKAQSHILQVAPQHFYEQTIGQTVSTVLRKGKYIILPLSNDNVIVFHLGMTGRLLLSEVPDITFDERFSGDSYVNKHTHFLIEFMDMSGDSLPDLELHFNDVRLFGKIWLVEDAESIDELDVPGLKDLGPDALGISLKNFEEVMCSKRSIKSILLDQVKIAGVGNIYADEALFSAHIHPATRGSSLTPNQTSTLWFAVKSVLKQGIKYRGSSTSDYTTTDGSKGSYQDYHRVYGKTGQKCTDCGSAIERIKIIGRSTHFCPSCQPEGTA